MSGTVKIVRHGHIKGDSPLARFIIFRGYTAAEVGKGTGIDKDTMSDYCNGRAPRSSRDGTLNTRHGGAHNAITPHHLVRLCAYLKCEPEDIQNL